MLNRTLAAAVVLIALGFLVTCVTGCGGVTARQPTGSQSGTPKQNADPEIEAALAKLSAEDRAVAEKQGTCPVTKEPLGSMGTPIKVTVDDRSVFVCCAACVDTVKEKPDEYLTEP